MKQRPSCELPTTEVTTTATLTTLERPNIRYPFYVMLILIILEQRSNAAHLWSSIFQERELKKCVLERALGLDLTAWSPRWTDDIIAGYQ